MERAKQHSDRVRFPVNPFFSPAEISQVNAFVAATGRKAGPWVRTLILAAIANEAGREPVRETKAVGE